MDSIYESKPINAVFPFKLGLMKGTESFVFHWHGLVEILLSVNGFFNIGIAGNTYKVDEGEIIIIGPNESHCIFPSDESAKRIAGQFDPSIVFSRTAFQENKRCFSDIKKLSHDWDPQTQEAVRDNILTMYKEYRAKDPGWMVKMLSEVLNVVTTCIRDIPKEDKSKLKDADNSSLRLILEYLASNFKDDISLKSCAAEFGFNESYLSTYFKKSTGINFLRYLQNIRLNESKWLLKNTDLSVAEVAENSGFSSQKTFFRVFQQKYGMTPGTYRDS